MRALMWKSFIAAVIAAGVAGCANTGGKAANLNSASPPTQAAKTPANLAPGEQVDYAGHRCGNPNLYVKTHLCVFPLR